MRIGLLKDQQPFAEFVNGNWRVWYIFNNDVTSGTYFELVSNGICDRVTVQDGEIMEINRISTPPTEPVDRWFPPDSEEVDRYIRGASL